MAPPRSRLAVHQGQRIGRGVVLDPDIRLAPTPAVPAGRRGARLLCDCGTEYETSLIALTSRGGQPANTQSCGCLGRERRRAATMTHGLASHPLYQTWAAVRDRCENPGTWEYHYYGGRGIRMWPGWADVARFIADVEREIGERPEGMTLDRVNNDGGYEPGNIRWATRQEQIANRHQPVALTGGRGFGPSLFYQELAAR